MRNLILNFQSLTTKIKHLTIFYEFEVHNYIVILMNFVKIVTLNAYKKYYDCVFSIFLN